MMTKGSKTGSSTQGEIQKHSTLWLSIAGLLVISLACALIYGPLFKDPEAIPWGSDTLGHVFRYEFLRESMQQGIWFPDFVPEWYLGIQLFRYYPPLIYYGLAILSPLFSSPILLSTWFVVVCAWLGSISWLLFHKTLSWFPAIIGGILYLLLPDLVRVAFAEGNLLRHFANTLLPLTLFLLYTCIHEPDRRIPRLLLGFVFGLLVLSHPMMASITAAMSVLFLSLSSVFHKLRFTRYLTILAVMVTGILLSAFWLLPSMTGGITELSREAMIAGLPVAPLLSLFNPSIRIDNKEALYVGVSLFLLPIILVFIPQVRKNKDFWAFLITGIIGCLLVTPLLNHIFYALPLSTLMWPARFLTIASLYLLAAVLWGFKLILQESPKRSIQLVSMAVILVPLLLDFSGSRHLIFNRPGTPEYTVLAAELSMNTGWRQATIDYSRAASAPSYYAYETARREQLFGWGFQGASTAALVSGINESLQGGWTAYALDRFDLTGVDDLWVAKQIPQPYQFEQALQEAGFQRQTTGITFDTYHRDGMPRAVIAPWDAICIGIICQNYAYLFPQIITADSPDLDDYTFEELSAYKMIILAGFTWQDRNTAESLVLQLAQEGIKVVIDLTRSKENPLSQQPNFLDVWGEPVILDRNPLLISAVGSSYQLSPFHADEELWYTITPQNLDQEILTTDFLGQSLVLSGYKEFGTARVWFIGLNLAYHAVINHDQGSVQILEDLLNIPAALPSVYTTIPMQSYQNNGKEISFTLSLDQEQQLLLPFAHFDGTRVQVDGHDLPARAISTLIQVTAPAGTHRYTISFSKPPIFHLGILVSILAVPGLGILVLNREKYHAQTIS